MINQEDLSLSLYKSPCPCPTPTDFPWQYYLAIVAENKIHPIISQCGTVTSFHGASALNDSLKLWPIYLNSINLSLVLELTPAVFVLNTVQ